MNRHTSHRLGRGLMMLALIVTLLAAGSSLAWASEEPDNGRTAGPDAVWDPPFIFITKYSSSSIKLSWDNPDAAITLYQVWRSEAPYFVPPAGGTMIDAYGFAPGVFTNAPFEYVDKGSCGDLWVNGSQFDPPPCTPGPLPIVLGDVAHNYFWIVRAGDPTPDYDYANRVGEFDFALVAGS